MFGWEFPPYLSGGLGVASEGLVRGLVARGAEVVLVLPHHPFSTPSGRLSIVDAGQVSEAERSPRRKRFLLRLRRVPSLLRPYMTEAIYEAEWTAARETRTAFKGHYGPNLASEVMRYAEVAGTIARRERFDVIHAHDWLTFLAGVEARRVSGRPLAVHVHATEFDRAGGDSNRFVSDIERLGLTLANRVVAVSRYTAGLVADRYGVPASRIRVVHNAIDRREAAVGEWRIGEKEPLILFAGRITWQKGPGHFVDAAALVAREIPDARFAVAGAGDGMTTMIERVAALGLSDRFLFTGYLAPAELGALYARADVYVMPSVSEPFGLTALEALQHGTPVIVSRHAGVSEVIRNVLRADVDEPNDLASKILSVLLFPPLSSALSEGGRAEVDRLSWAGAAGRCLEIYEEMIAEGTR